MKLKKVIKPVKPKMKAALMLGVNPNFKREENDFYATHPHALEVFMPKLEQIGLHNNVWECACGMGHLSKVLIEWGYNVYSSDLIDRGYGQTHDFLRLLKCPYFDNRYDILTNPPFKDAEKFVEKSMQLLYKGNKCILFLKIQFLESIQRKKLFEKYPPKYVFINSERQKCAMNADFEKYNSKSTQCYCWFVWEKGYQGHTTLDWI